MAQEFSFVETSGSAYFFDHQEQRDVSTARSDSGENLVLRPANSEYYMDKLEGFGHREASSVYAASSETSVDHQPEDRSASAPGEQRLTVDVEQLFGKFHYQMEVC